MSSDSATSLAQGLTTVIPVYNGERFLPATLDSIAAQSVRPERLVVVDDCSTDSTRDLVVAFQGAHPELRCDLVQNPQNLGLFKNLNRALDFASETDILHLLLADDLVSPDFCRVILPALREAPGCSIAFSGTEYIDQDGRPLGRAVPAGGSHVTRWPKKEFIGRQMQLQTVLCGSILLRTAYKPPVCRFRTDLPQVADCVFYAEWALHSEYVLEVPAVLCQIRQHPFNATHKNRQSLQSWVSDEWRAISLIASMLPVNGGAGWMRWKKLECLFSARSHVKRQQVKASDPEFARAIRDETRRLVGRGPWVLGGLAVALRDRLKRN